MVNRECTLCKSEGIRRALTSHTVLSSFVLAYTHTHTYIYIYMYIHRDVDVVVLYRYVQETDGYVDLAEDALGLSAEDEVRTEWSFSWSDQSVGCHGNSLWICYYATKSPMD